MPIQSRIPMVNLIQRAHSGYLPIICIDQSFPVSVRNKEHLKLEGIRQSTTAQCWPSCEAIAAVPDEGFYL